MAIRKEKTVGPYGGLHSLGVTGATFIRILLFRENNRNKLTAMEKEGAVNPYQWAAIFSAIIGPSTLVEVMVEEKYHALI